MNVLLGDLGAGKTTLSRGIIRGKFHDNDMIVTSPSYLLDNSYNYAKNKHIHHMDLYRLPVGYPDMGILGIPGIFKTALCIVEWPDRLTSQNLPESYVDVKIELKPGSFNSISIPAYISRSEDNILGIDSIGNHKDDIIAEYGNDNDIDQILHEDSHEKIDTEAIEEQEEVEEEIVHEDERLSPLSEPIRLITLRFIGKQWHSKAHIMKNLLTKCIS